VGWHKITRLASQDNRIQEKRVMMAGNLNVKKCYWSQVSLRERTQKFRKSSYPWESRQDKCNANTTMTSAKRTDPFIHSTHFSCELLEIS
jgi:hypothetical protein